MEIIRKEYSLPSKFGVATLYARCWLPAEGLKVMVQFSHGMAEHGERYEDMAQYLCAQGIGFFIHDHVGHGKSVRSDADLGYFGEKDGWDAFVEDCRQFTLLIEQEYPALPIIFFGHSMGSFIAREYIRRYGTDPCIKGAIICGTSGRNPASAVAITIANTVAKLKGSRHKSNFINNVAFGTYNKRIQNPRTPFDWLSTDTAQVDQYVADPYSGFLFTAVGYRDLFTILTKVSGKDWFAAVNADLPILLIAGEEDPVGAYGAGVKQVYNNLKAAGKKDVTLKLYPGMRHEIHNEVENTKVYDDIAAWILAKAKV